MSLWSTSENARNTLDWEPFINIDEGIVRTIKYYSQELLNE